MLQPQPSGTRFHHSSAHHPLVADNLEGENPSLHTGLRTCENTFVEEHIITRHSFVRAKGEVFVLLYVFFSVCSLFY